MFCYLLTTSQGGEQQPRVTEEHSRSIRTQSSSTQMVANSPGINESVASEWNAPHSFLGLLLDRWLPQHSKYNIDGIVYIIHPGFNLQYGWVDMIYAGSISHQPYSQTCMDRIPLGWHVDTAMHSNWIMKIVVKEAIYIWIAPESSYFQCYQLITFVRVLSILYLVKESWQRCISIMTENTILSAGLPHTKKVMPM